MLALHTPAWNVRCERGVKILNRVIRTLERSMPTCIPLLCISNGHVGKDLQTNRVQGAVSFSSPCSELKKELRAF